MLAIRSGNLASAMTRLPGCGQGFRIWGGTFSRWRCESRSWRRTTATSICAKRASKVGCPFKSASRYLGFSRFLTRGVSAIMAWRVRLTCLCRARQTGGVVAAAAARTTAKIPKKSFQQMVGSLGLDGHDPARCLYRDGIGKEFFPVGVDLGDHFPMRFVGGIARRRGDLAAELTDRFLDGSHRQVRTPGDLRMEGTQPLGKGHVWTVKRKTITLARLSGLQRPLDETVGADQGDRLRIVRRWNPGLETLVEGIHPLRLLVDEGFQSFGVVAEFRPDAMTTQRRPHPVVWVAEEIGAQVPQKMKMADEVRDMRKHRLDCAENAPPHIMDGSQGRAKALFVPDAGWPPTCPASCTPSTVDGTADSGFGAVRNGASAVRGTAPASNFPRRGGPTTGGRSPGFDGQWSDRFF